jgi:hypothetical protein
MTTVDEKVKQLQQLVSEPDFQSAREDLFRKIVTKYNLSREPVENRSKIVAAEFPGDLSFGPLNALFLELVEADLSSLGPVSLFINTSGWSSLTVYSSDRMTIQKTNDEELEIGLGFVFPTPPAGMGEILNEMQQRWDQRFPILCGQWRQFVVEGALAPATEGIWFRISSEARV